MTKLEAVSIGAGDSITVQSVKKTVKHFEREFRGSYPIIWLEVGDESSSFDSWESQCEIGNIFDVKIDLWLTYQLNDDHFTIAENAIVDVKKALLADPTRGQNAEWSILDVSGPRIDTERNYLGIEFLHQSRVILDPSDP